MAVWKVSGQQFWQLYALICYTRICFTVQQTAVGNVVTHTHAYKTIRQLTIDTATSMYLDTCVPRNIITAYTHVHTLVYMCTRLQAPITLSNCTILGHCNLTYSNTIYTNYTVYCTVQYRCRALLYRITRRLLSMSLLTSTSLRQYYTLLTCHTIIDHRTLSNHTLTRVPL